MCPETFEICLERYWPVAHIRNCNPESYQLSANTFTKNCTLLAGFFFSLEIWSRAGEVQLTIKGLARLSGYLSISYSDTNFLSEFAQDPENTSTLQSRVAIPRLERCLLVATCSATQLPRCSGISVSVWLFQKLFPKYRVLIYSFHPNFFL